MKRLIASLSLIAFTAIGVTCAGPTKSPATSTPAKVATPAANDDAAPSVTTTTPTVAEQDALETAAVSYPTPHAFDGSVDAGNQCTLCWQDHGHPNHKGDFDKPHLFNGNAPLCLFCGHPKYAKAHNTTSPVVAHSPPAHDPSPAPARAVYAPMLPSGRYELRSNGAILPRNRETVKVWVPYQPQQQIQYGGGCAGGRCGR